MLSRKKHITGLLSLLICLSLGLSTAHTHEQFKWDQDSPAASAKLPNSIAKDTNLCPVNGYLFGANIAHPITANIILTELGTNSYFAFEIYEQPSLLNHNNRSPPFQV